MATAARDPSWGRIEETPGEDPYVNGEYAYAFTKGFQEGYGDMRTGNKYIKASVTVKVSLDVRPNHLRAPISYTMDTRHAACLPSC